MATRWEAIRSARAVHCARRCRRSRTTTAWPWRGCTAATVGQPNTIDIAVAGTIVINSAVPDPNQPVGQPPIRKRLSAERDGRIVARRARDHEQRRRNRELRCRTERQDHFQRSERRGPHAHRHPDRELHGRRRGIAISNVNGGNLTLSGVSFTNIKSDTGGPGGAVAHSGGSLAMGQRDLHRMQHGRWRRTR